MSELHYFAGMQELYS